MNLWRGFVLNRIALVEETLDGWVDVTNVRSNITPSLSPFDEAFSGSMSDLVQTVMRLMSTIVSYLG